MSSETTIAAEDTTYTHLIGRGHNVHTPYWKKNKVKQAKNTFFDREKGDHIENWQKLYTKLS